MQRGLPVRSATDRRQPQKSDLRRNAILESLDHHLREVGLDGINIADVTRRAGVTRSAFYFYFENKAAAVAALLEPMYDDGFLASDILTATTRPPRARAASIAAGSTLTSVPSDTLPSRGRVVWSSTRSGGCVVVNSRGTSDSLEGV